MLNMLLVCCKLDPPIIEFQIGNNHGIKSHLLQIFPVNSSEAKSQNHKNNKTNYCLLRISPQCKNT